ncbi:MAG: heavy metal-binding domain-containing protein [Bacteroidota bacterium]
MKNIINSLFVLAFALLLSTSVLAQEKPMKAHPESCTCENCSTVEHKCTAECKHEETKAMKTSEVKHVHTDECQEKSCDYVKAKEARAALDVNGDGAIYECPMKCDASDQAGKCSKCGMELKKVSVKES